MTALVWSSSSILREQPNFVRACRGGHPEGHASGRETRAGAVRELFKYFQSRRSAFGVPVAKAQPIGGVRRPIRHLHRHR
jgi:hypothetical protein